MFAPSLVVVRDDQLSERAAGGNPGKCRADPSGAHQENTHGQILDLDGSADETGRDT